ERRGGVEPAGERSGEAGGHVLDDHDTGADLRRQLRDQLAEGLRAAGRAGDHHEALADDRGAAEWRVRRTARSEASRRAADTAAVCGLVDLLAQLGGEDAEVLAERGL